MKLNHRTILTAGGLILTAYINPVAPLYAYGPGDCVTVVSSQCVYPGLTIPSNAGIYVERGSGAGSGSGCQSGWVTGFAVTAADYGTDMVVITTMYGPGSRVCSPTEGAPCHPVGPAGNSNCQFYAWWFDPCTGTMVETLASFGPTYQPMAAFNGIAYPLDGSCPAQ